MSVNLKDFIQSLVNAVCEKTGRTGTINAQDLISEIHKISSGGTIDETITITENGSYDVYNYGIAIVDVRGRPYEFDWVQMQSFLGSPKSESGDIVFNTESQSYYKVVKPGNGEEPYYLELGASSDVWDGSYVEIGSDFPSTSTTGSGYPIEMYDAGEMDELLNAENVGKIYLYLGETTKDYTYNTLYRVC